jgi:hypothetical protein
LVTPHFLYRSWKPLTRRVEWCIICHIYLKGSLRYSISKLITFENYA